LTEGVIAASLQHPPQTIGVHPNSPSILLWLLCAYASVSHPSRRLAAVCTALARDESGVQKRKPRQMWPKFDTSGCEYQCDDVYHTSRAVRSSSVLQV